MSMYFDTLVKALSFSLAFQRKDVICSWKVRLLSVFIPSSSLEKLALIHEFCICIDFISYGLIKMAFARISYSTVLVKPFEYVQSTIVGSGIIYITRKINVIVYKI